MTTGKLQIKRAYAPYDTSDGYRVLVDRLWPRGFTKERLQCQRWAKEISPSQELRKRFHGTPDFTGFTADYVTELDENEAARSFVTLCRAHLNQGNVTLVYASKDEVHNNAVVLQNWLTAKI